MPVTEYLWDDETDTVVMETDEAGATQAVYHSDPVQYGRLFSMRRGGSTYNYRYDGQGNTRALTDDTGKTTDTYRYDAWGNQRAHSGTTKNPYHFGGQHGYQYNENSGDYYVRARPYESTQGRWASQDPLRFVDGINRFVYAGNGPSNASDPSGLAKFWICCTYQRCCQFNNNLPESITRTRTCETTEKRADARKCCRDNVPSRGLRFDCSAYEEHGFTWGPCSLSFSGKDCLSALKAWRERAGGPLWDADEAFLKCSAMCKKCFPGTTTAAEKVHDTCVDQICKAVYGKKLW